MPGKSKDQRIERTIAAIRFFEREGSTEKAGPFRAHVRRLYALLRSNGWEGGLEIGGDDYVTKPFSVEALVARVRAVHRRASRTAGPDQAADAGLLRAGNLELDEARWTVRRADTPVELSPTEFRLLAYLMRHQGRVLTRAQLLENVWGWDYAGESQIVETYVSYLRRKLDPLGPPLIHTQRGVGYSLRPDEGGHRRLRG
jgi:two-component system OmpR family response regulator